MFSRCSDGWGHSCLVGCWMLDVGCVCISCPPLLLLFLLLLFLFRVFREHFLLSPLFWTSG